MPKRSSNLDSNETAYRTLQEVIRLSDGTGKNQAAVALGRLGGLKGGKARAESLTKSERSAISKKGAEARWAKHRKRKNKPDT